jgi:ABC-type bacteriocin/lantibiotic exporter with double-glycine peptidase domain
MNFLSAIIDSFLGFVSRNPLTTIIIVMLLVFAPSLFGALLIGVVVLVLILLAIPLFMLFRLRRASRNFQEQARHESQQSYSQREYTQQGYSQPKSEGDVKVHATTQQPQKRVNDNVGDYVEFEEVKEQK